jgi:hypothetical protein
MKLKRKDIPDPMKFIVSEIGEDEKGKYAIVSAKNMETGEIITKKMYEDKTYDSQKDFSETVGNSSEAVSSDGGSEEGGGEGEPEPESNKDTILLAPGTTYYVIGRRIKRKKKKHD